MYRIRKLITILFYKSLTKSLGKNSVIYKPFKFSFKNIEIGDNFYLGPNARIEAVKVYNGVVFEPRILIGNHVTIEQNLHLTCASTVSIGDNSAIAANVSITDIIHQYEDILIPPEKQDIKACPTYIGVNCKIYNNAVILPGTRLGRHNIVAANAVVLKKDYPDYCVLAGSPAKIVKIFSLNLNKWIKINKDDDLFMDR